MKKQQTMEINIANNKYKLKIILRTKIRITQEQFDFINKLFSEKMTKGQSISVFYQNHKDENYDFRKYS